MQGGLSPVYQRLVNTWTNHLPCKTKQEKAQWATAHHKQVAERIAGYTNVNTRALHYQALAALLRHMQLVKIAKQYSAEASRLHKISMAAEQTQSLSPSELKKWLPLSQIVARARQLASQVRLKPLDRKANLQHLLLSMYTLQPPLRREYSNMAVLQRVPRAATHNYMLRSGPGLFTIVIYKDKISRHAGPGKFKVSPSLGRIIESSLQRYPRAYLFSLLHNPGKPSGGQSFDRLLGGIWPDKKVTVNVLRSAYVTAFYEHRHDVASRDRLAAQMRHSRHIAELCYRKHNTGQQAPKA